jgi:hypothetical protein
MAINPNSILAALWQSGIPGFSQPRRGGFGSLVAPQPGSNEINRQNSTLGGGTFGAIAPGMVSTQDTAGVAALMSGGVGSMPSVNQDPYGGRTMAQILRPGAFGANPSDAEQVANWANMPATNEGVGYAMRYGAQYQPDVAKTLQSSGPEGGWFSSSDTAQESTVPWGSYPNSGANPAPGLSGMSTNNWRNLPSGYQSPQWAMRSGHLIDRYWTDKPLAYVGYHGGGEAPWGLGGGGHGFPVSTGSSNQRGYFWPGQIDPWVYEGGPGTT